MPHTKVRPGRPEGGEAIGLRAIYRYRICSHSDYTSNVINIVNHITGSQAIEHWAKLGCAVETALRHADVLTLKRNNGDLIKSSPEPSEREAMHALLERIAATTDHSTVVEKLQARGKPVYATDPHYPGMAVRIDPDGRRTPGHFMDRRFVPADEA